MRKLRGWLVMAIVAVSAATSIPVALAAGSAAPTATSAPATSVTGSGATLNGSVNPNGQQTSYAFQWGATSTYGQETPLTSAGAGSSSSSVSASLSGLTGGSTYHFRLLATNPSGTTYGADETFTTSPAPPAVTTGAASQVRKSSAVLNGTLDPKGRATSFYFEYGTSPAYGLQTSPASAGSGTGDVGVHASITGLVTNTTYHYRLVAQNSDGTSYGADATVTVGQLQSQVRFIGHMGFVSPGRVIGVEAGCFGGDARCVGQVTMSHNGIVIGQGSFNIAPNSGGFQNIEISGQGESMLYSYNGVFHLLPVTVTVSTTTGQKTSQVMHLARWVWH